MAIFRTPQSNARRLAVTLCVLGLGGCAQIEAAKSWLHRFPSRFEAAQREVAPPPAKPLPPRQVAVAPAKRKRPAVVAAPAPTPAPAPEPALESPAEPQDEPVPLDLTGRSPAEVTELLGRPDAETAEPPGQVWRYSDGQCEIEVHFFPEVSQGSFRALDVKAVGAGLSPAQCAGRLHLARGL